MAEEIKTFVCEHPACENLIKASRRTYETHCKRYSYFQCEKCIPERWEKEMHRCKNCNNLFEDLRLHFEDLRLHECGENSETVQFYCSNNNCTNESKINMEVNHPQHYTFGKFEVIDVIEDWELNFHLGNAVKYIARCDHKGHKLKDLKKAKWYLERAIKELDGELQNADI